MMHPEFIQWLEKQKYGWFADRQNFREIDYLSFKWNEMIKVIKSVQFEGIEIRWKVI